MKKIALFADVQNIYYTVRDTYQGFFNYQALWDQLSQDYQIVSANAYAIDRDNAKQKSFQQTLRNMGFDVNLKPFIQRADGSAKGDWDVCSAFKIDDSFENNEMILKSLEHGSNHINLEIVNKNPNWSKIFENIFIEIIHVSISFHHPEQIETFKLFIFKKIIQHFLLERLILTFEPLPQIPSVILEEPVYKDRKSVV